MPAVTEVSSRKPHFPATSVCLLAGAVVALFAISNWANSQCSFGFGGFGCTGAFVGWGEALLVAALALIALVGVLTFSTGWLIFRWWRGR